MMGQISCKIMGKGKVIQIGETKRKCYVLLLCIKKLQLMECRRENRWNQSEVASWPERRVLAPVDSKQYSLFLFDNIFNQLFTLYLDLNVSIFAPAASVLESACIIS